MFHVSPSGSNTPPYDTYAKAANHPRDAILSATGAGDTVVVHAGTYTLETITELPSGLTLQGVDRDSAVLVWNSLIRGADVPRTYGDLTVSGLTFLHAQPSYDPDAHAISTIRHGHLKVMYCRFDGMEIVAGSDGDMEITGNEFFIRRSGVVGVLAYADVGGTLRIHDNYFLGGSDGGIGVTVTFGDVLIERNTFNCAQTGKHGFSIYVDAPSFGRVTVRNNVMLGGSGAILWDYATGEVSNNLIVGPESSNEFSGGNIFSQRNYDTLLIRNNFFLDLTREPIFQNECGQACRLSGPYTYINNAFWPPRDSFVIIPSPDIGRVRLHASGNFNAYPMFADSTYQLQYGSPLIDAGDPALVDPDGTRSDIGVHGGAYGIVHEYLDLPPLPPESLALDGEVRSVLLSWTGRPEGDLYGYRVYRGDQPGFWMPGAPILVELDLQDTSFSDQLPESIDTAFYVVTAVDSASQESSPSSEHAYIVADYPANRAPEFVDISPQTVDAGDTLSLTITATDADSDPLTISAQVPSVNAAFVDFGGGHGIFAFTPDTSQIGEHQIQFIASDGRLADTLTLSVYVADTSGTLLPLIPRLVRVYPNPLNDAAIIEVGMPNVGAMPAPVEIVVIDVLGRKVTTAHNSSMNPGLNSVSWDLEQDQSGIDLASGVYFVVLKVWGRTFGSPHKVAVIR